MTEPPLKDPTPLKHNYVPRQIIDRQQEKQRIKKAFAETVTAQNLFIHGPRGTGKSHITHLLLDQLDDRTQKCYVPCSKHNTQYKALKHIYNGLSNETVGNGHHTSDLQRKVVEKTQGVDTVILLDEIDFLISNNSGDLLYFLTRMETRENTSIVLISSNHQDLKNRIEERTYSSLQPRRIGFEPYTAEEAYRIYVERARNALKPETLERAALTYIASTTQNISIGLTWLKHAAETTEQKVTEEHVQQVQKDALQQYAANLLQEFTNDHRLLYQAIQELETENKDNIQAGEIYNRYEELCQTYNEDTLSKRRLSDFLKHLELLNLIKAKYHYGGQKGKTREVKIQDL